MRSLKFLQAIAIPRFARNDKFRDLRSRRASPRRDTPLETVSRLETKARFDATSRRYYSLSFSFIFNPLHSNLAEYTLAAAVQMSSPS